MQIRVIIPREEFPVKTIAIVVADKTETIRTATELREAITRAVTEWHGSDCPMARDSWEYAGDDFNVGDLTQYAWLAEDEGPDSDPGDRAEWNSRCKLPAILEAHGVKGLQIDVIDVDDVDDWNFDTHLSQHQPEDE